MPRLPILQSADIHRRFAPAAQPRAIGAVEVSAKAARNTTVLDNLFQSGSLKCLLPRNTGAGLEAVILNTAGGITGGDKFSLDAAAKTGCRMTLTTQTAERVYQAQPGKPGALTTRLHVSCGAQINWLPQETILFNGCALNRSLTVDLEDGARLLLAEPLVFGRAAMGETLTDASFHDRIEIRRGGVPIYLDALRLDGNIDAELARPFVAAGAEAMVSCIYVAPDAESYLSDIREMLPETAGASLKAPDMLVMRMLAKDSFWLRQRLIPILNLLSRNTLPRCWMT